LLLLGAVWGSSFILMKRALFATDGSALMAPLDLAAFRMAFAGTALLPVSWGALKRIRGVQRKWVFASGVIGSLIPAILFAVAQTHLPSALAGMLNALAPLWTLVFSVFLFRNHPVKRQVVGLFVGFTGALWMVGKGETLAVAGASALWPGLMIVAATMCYGLNVNITREKLAGPSGIQLASLSLGFIAIPSWGYVLFSQGFHRVLSMPEGATALLLVALLAVAGTAIALALFNQVIALTSSLFAASVTYIIPVFATLWGFLDGESLSLGHAAAGALILSGVAIINSGKKS
jgi:drug/metabolite transporter (DMT)-like permease